MKKDSSANRDFTLFNRDPGKEDWFFLMIAPARLTYSTCPSRMYFFIFVENNRLHNYNINIRVLIFDEKKYAVKTSYDNELNLAWQTKLNGLWTAPKKKVWKNDICRHKSHYTLLLVSSITKSSLKRKSIVLVLFKCQAFNQIVSMLYVRWFTEFSTSTTERHKTMLWTPSSYSIYVCSESQSF